MHLRLFIFLTICSCIHTSSDLRVKYAGRALNALERLLNFFESDVNNLNLDGLYGLRIAQGQLNILAETFNSSSHFTDKNNHIQILAIQIERIANRSLLQLGKTSSSYLHRFALIANQPFRIEYQARKINEKYVEYGERTSDFDEDESDSCFAELLGSTDRPNATQCFITQTCWSMMTSPMTTDYRLTHQLLWFLVAKNIGCIDNRTISTVANKHLKYLEDRYCSNIYHDAQLNLQANDNQDLFLEQLLLCSIIGYEEFLRFDWLNTILTWQHSIYGCFGSEQSTMKIKRHLLFEQEMINGCLAHQSGLASGVLAVYARVFFIELHRS